MALTSQSEDQNQRAQVGAEQSTSPRQLRRSNALRIKSSNLELLSLSLRESLQAIRARSSTDEEDEDEDLSLLEQIKRGVKLKPVPDRGEHQQQARALCAVDQEESDSAILVRVLKQRYQAMQQSDGEVEGDDMSDSSSITSGGSDHNLYLIGYESVPRAGKAATCVLYGGAMRPTAGGGGETKRTLLERLGEYSTIKMRSAGLTNDLVIRL